MAALRPAVFEHPFLEALVPGFVDQLIDEDGRPLAEDNAPDALKVGVAFDYQACPYADGRRGGSMNTTALRQLASCWPEVLDDLLVLRAVFMRHFPVEMSYFLLARLADFLTSLPGFLVRTSVLKADDVPRDLSGLFKAAQGLYLTANDALLPGGHEVAFDPVSVQAFLDHTEAHRIFWVGEKVCAGSPALVRRFVTLAIEGDASSPASSWLAPHVQGVAAIRYAELKLQAQMARRVFDAWMQDALDASLERAPATRGPALASLNQRSALRLDASELARRTPEPALLRPLVLASETVGHRQGMALCARVVPLLLHYLAYVEHVQRQINSVIGREETSARLRCQQYLDLRQAFDPAADRAILQRVHGPSLAMLVDRIAGAD